MKSLSINCLISIGLSINNLDSYLPTTKISVLTMFMAKTPRKSNLNLRCCFQITPSDNSSSNRFQVSPRIRKVIEGIPSTKIFFGKA